MPARVTLTVIRGKLQGQSYTFEERTSCILGRAEDCVLRLPDDRDHRTISRHHCLLDINPPDVRIRDFGSLNGTCVNGTIIGQRSLGQPLQRASQEVFPEHDLQDGDQIELGNTVLEVRVYAPTVCDDCGKEIPEEEKSASQRPSGVLVCAACWGRSELQGERLPPPTARLQSRRQRACARCGRMISVAEGVPRPGDLVCASCRADPGQVLQMLLAMARSGSAELVAIQGYQIVRELGKGGMGAVYLARHEKTGLLAALKVLLPRVAADEHSRSSFLREAANTRALRHANIVQLHESGWSNGVSFLTLEYCDGGSIDQLVVEHGPLSVAEAVPIILQALEGLEYAHQAPVPYTSASGVLGNGRGLVHRDLKPANLLLSGTGSTATVKIADFGLAKAFDSAGLSGHTRTGALAGTPVFMPRQQVISFKYARPEVDVWAMAATLYFMLTGCLTRDYPRGKDVWQVVLQNPCIPIRERNPAIPERLAKVIDHALQEKPSIGFPSAADFKRALEGGV